MTIYEANADAVVRLMTILGFIILGGTLVYGVVRIVDGQKYIGTALVAFSIGVLLLSYLFSVRNYGVDSGHLYINRAIGAISIPLNEAVINRSPGVLDGAIRMFGNGGLFSINGLFYSKKAGWFRAYIKNSKNCLSVRYRGKNYVISPDDADGFMKSAGA